MEASSGAMTEALVDVRVGTEGGWGGAMTKALVDVRVGTEGGWGGAMTKALVDVRPVRVGSRHRGGRDAGSVLSGPSNHPHSHQPSSGSRLIGGCPIQLAQSLGYNISQGPLLYPTLPSTNKSVSHCLHPSSHLPFLLPRPPPKRTVTAAAPNLMARC